MAEKEIRNLSHIELPTDVKTKDGKQVVLQPYGKLDLDKVDEKSLNVSLANGRLKGYIDRKFVIYGAIIKGDAKKIEKVNKEDAKKIEAKVADKKKEVKVETKPEELK